MEKQSNIFNIKSNYNLKLIFSYLDYQYILKLVKYNKRLQNKLGINIENDKNNSTNPKYILRKAKDYGDRNFDYYSYKKPEVINGEAELGLCCLPFCSTLIYFLYTLIYSILLVFKESFNDDNTSKEKYEEKLNTIANINLSLFALILSILIANIVFIFRIYKEHDDNYKRGWRNLIIKILLILYFNTYII